MTAYSFILSNEGRDRLKRHLVLWAFFCIYFFVVNFTPTSIGAFSDSKTYVAALDKMMYIPVSILSAYISAYFLLPRYILRGNYFSFAFLFFGLCLLNLFNAFWITKLYALLTQKAQFNQLPTQIKTFQPIIYGLGLGTASGIFAGVSRLLKINYLKEKENERLARQKITTEMEIIKNHFHPHFLSESLRNISHLIRNRSEQSAQSIIKLADLLSYFLYENEAEHVSLDQELQMVRTYLELEKLFYGERINVSLKEEGISSGPFVAPLIIVSIVQYCCEQSLLSIQQNLSVDIQVQSAADRVKFYLNCNGYYENINGVARDHTTLDQVIKRVQALYPGKHNLKTHSENGIFSLMLALNHEDEELDLRPEIKPAYELA